MEVVLSSEVFLDDLIAGPVRVSEFKLPVEEVDVGFVSLEVFPERSKCSYTERYDPIFAAFGLADHDDHARGVYVCELEITNLRDSHACAEC